MAFGGRHASDRPRSIFSSSAARLAFAQYSEPELADAVRLLARALPRRS